VAGVENGEKRIFDNLSASGAKNSSADDAAVATSSSATSNDSNSQEAQQPIQILEPFALLDELFSNSPASTASNQEGDILIQFGHIDCTNHKFFWPLPNWYLSWKEEVKVWKLGLGGGKKWGIVGKFWRSWS
jgi:hypothetical protein